MEHQYWSARLLVRGGLNHARLKVGMRQLTLTLRFIESCGKIVVEG
ncbi:hypothetical protein TAMC210_09470 [Thermanaeromonas sp. C210]|nr:hypothetical protein TAMC210_09470 [Thermanaeromonas sp. C210]